ncbi:hypothetical protein EV401DRAFT_1887216 [Pisolithus croceorrhizus]|nr:hypothetical protein EV401DRAFT_1887216 [Pisolithus croceorrhizus]
MQQTAISCLTNISPIEACISWGASTPRSLMEAHVSLHVTSQVTFFSSRSHSTVSDTLDNGILINAGITWVMQLDGGCGYRDVGTSRTLRRKVSEVVRLYRDHQDAMHQRNKTTYFPHFQPSNVRHL